MIDAENAAIRKSYNRRFDKLLSMPQQEALHKFYETKEELHEKYEREKNKERRESGQPARRHLRMRFYPSKTDRISLSVLPAFSPPSPLMVFGMGA